MARSLYRPATADRQHGGQRRGEPAGGIQLVLRAAVSALLGRPQGQALPVHQRRRRAYGLLQFRPDRHRRQPGRDQGPARGAGRPQMGRRVASGRNHQHPQDARPLCRVRQGAGPPVRPGGRVLAELPLRQPTADQELADLERAEHLSVLAHSAVRVALRQPADRRPPGDPERGSLGHHRPGRDAQLLVDQPAADLQGPGRAGSL